MDQSARLLLIDTDVFALLAGAGMLDQVIEGLGFDRSTTRRLPFVRAQMKRGRNFCETYSLAIRNRVIKRCEDIPSLPARASEDSTFEPLTRVDEIDYGETQLIALLAENEHFILTTGDKRALRALCDEESLSGVRRKVEGRIVCLESVIRLLVDRLGIEAAAKAFTPMRDVNKMLSVVFSQGNATPEADCRDYLGSYLRELESDLGEDFLYKP